MDQPDAHWVKIADNVTDISFNANHIAEAEVDGKKLCIATDQQSYFAFTTRCPHAGGLLINGYIDASGNVVCPLHGYKFCLKNGRNVSGEGYCLKSWPVVIKEDGVYVGLEKSPLAGGR